MEGEWLSLTANIANGKAWQGQEQNFEKSSRGVTTNEEKNLLGSRYFSRYGDVLLARHHADLWRSRLGEVFNVWLFTLGGSMRLTCQKCGQEARVVREELLDSVVISECCYAPIMNGNEQFTIFDYEREQLITAAEYKMDMLREQALLEGW
jgi:hypothetical protein